MTVKPTLSLSLHEAAGLVLRPLRVSCLIVLRGVSSWYLWQKPMSKQWLQCLPPIIHSVHFCFRLSVCHMNMSGPVSVMNFNESCWKEFFLRVETIPGALLSHSMFLTALRTSTHSFEESGCDSRQGKHILLRNVQTWRPIRFLIQW
jgi:hypothetical protein